MSQSTTSLDIQAGAGEALDVTHFFPMARTRTIDTSVHGAWCDNIVSGEGISIDISSQHILSVVRYRTLETLDIAHPEVINMMKWKSGFISSIPRPRTLSVMDPLYVPYGALDIRNEQKIVSHNTYPDIFARRLPYSLVLRKIRQSIQGWYGFHRGLIRGVIVTGLLIIIPLLSYAGYALTRGYEKLGSLVNERDPGVFVRTIASARGDFERADILLSPLAWIPIERITTLVQVSRGGLSLIRGMDLIASELPLGSFSGETLEKVDTDPLSYRKASRDVFFLESLGIQNPTDWIREHKNTLQNAQNELKKAGDSYASIVPTGERTQKLKNIGFLLQRLTGVMNFALVNDAMLLSMLGDTNPQRYIVLNQNRDEIRTNGGFPGSILSFTLYKGNILDYRTDDVYYYDWNLYPYKEIPPPGIALLTGNYGLRDVNYYPDFLETLTKANNFIERSGDASVTTAFALHQGIIEAMLQVTGPITLSGVSIAFTAENFSPLMSTLVENKYAKEHTPKDILFQFIGAFLQKLKEKDYALMALDIGIAALKDGEIMFASRDPEIESWLSHWKKPLPWQCEEYYAYQKSVPGEYTHYDTCPKNWVYPIFTSVSGNKSDRYIDRTYRSSVRHIDACLYENTITLKTTHTFEKSDKDELVRYFDTFGIMDIREREKMSFIQGDGKNRSYVRIFAPRDATLTMSGGAIETEKTDAYTVFSFLMETPVATSVQKTIQYQLNLGTCNGYTGAIDWIRQPGIRTLTFE